MKRAPHPIRWVLTSMGVMAASMLVLTATTRSRGVNPSGSDQAPERARAQAKVLDDLLKVAIVAVVNRCDGPPGA